MTLSDLGFAAEAAGSQEAEVSCLRGGSNAHRSMYLPTLNINNNEEKGGVSKAISRPARKGDSNEYVLKNVQM